MSNQTSPKFKPGQKVRVIEGASQYLCGYKPGDTFIVAYMNGKFVVPVGKYYPNGSEICSGIESRNFELDVEAKPKAKRDYVADHARRTLRAAGATAEQAAALVKAFAFPLGTNKLELSSISRKLPSGSKLSGLVLTHIEWSAAAKALGVNGHWFSKLHAELQAKGV